MQKIKEEGKNNANGLKYLHSQLSHFIKEETEAQGHWKVVQSNMVGSATANHQTRLTWFQSHLVGCKIARKLENAQNHMLCLCKHSIWGLYFWKCVCSFPYINSNVHRGKFDLMLKHLLESSQSLKKWSSYLYTVLIWCCFNVTAVIIKVIWATEVWQGVSWATLHLKRSCLHGLTYCIRSMGSLCFPDSI